MVKKVLAMLGIAGFLATAGIAFAQTSPTTSEGGAASPATASVAPRTQPMVLEVSPRGRALLRGTVDSVSADSLTVKSWGGSWTINVSSASKVLPNGAALSSFQQGDFVGVEGTVSQDSSLTIDATLVRDWTERKAVHQEIRQNIRSVHQEMRSGTPRIVEGTVSNLDASAETFTLTAGNGTGYSVSLASNAKTLQRNWTTLAFSAVQNGDTVRVWGPVASTTISASIFRDVSIPRQ